MVDKLEVNLISANAAEKHYALQRLALSLLDKENLAIGKPSGADRAKGALMPLGEKRVRFFPFLRIPTGVSGYFFR